MTPGDDDEFTELVDADLPRVDLVGKGANGMPFLVAKAALMPSQVVRDLVSKSEKPMIYSYRHRGLIIKSRRRLTLGEVRTVAAQHVAKGSASMTGEIVPVYDADGTLVGTVDPAKINTFGAYPGAETVGEQDLTPAPADEMGQPSSGVAKTVSLWGSRQPSPEEQASNTESLSRRLDEIVNGLARRYGLRDAEERAIAKQAVARVVAGRGHDISPAAVAIIEAHAARAAAAAIERHRATGRRP